MSWLFSASLRVRRSITSSKIHTHTKKRFAAAGKYGVRHMGEREPPHTPPNSSAHQLRDPSRPISAIAAQRICFHCFSFWARSATTLQYKIQHSTDIVIHLHFICIFSGLLYGNELLGRFRLVFLWVNILLFLFFCFKFFFCSVLEMTWAEQQSGSFGIGDRRCILSVAIDWSFTCCSLVFHHRFRWNSINLFFLYCFIDWGQSALAQLIFW